MFSAEREESVFLTTDLSCRFEVEIANLVVISPGMESVAAHREVSRRNVAPSQSTMHTIFSTSM